MERGGHVLCAPARGDRIPRSLIRSEFGTTLCCGLSAGLFMTRLRHALGGGHCTAAQRSLSSTPVQRPGILRAQQGSVRDLQLEDPQVGALRQLLLSAGIADRPRRGAPWRSGGTRGTRTRSGTRSIASRSSSTPITPTSSRRTSSASSSRKERAASRSRTGRASSCRSPASTPTTITSSATSSCTSSSTTSPRERRAAD